MSYVIKKSAFAYSDTTREGGAIHLKLDTSKEKQECC